MLKAIVEHKLGKIIIIGTYRNIAEILGYLKNEREVNIQWCLISTSQNTEVVMKKSVLSKFATYMRKTR